MAIKVAIAYYYIAPPNLEQLLSFKSLSGDSETILVTQFVRGWISRNRDYYLTLARMDAAARRISFSEWGRTVVEKGMDGLPFHVEKLENIPPDPLRGVILPPDTTRRRLNYILLGAQNVALLRVGVYYDRGNAIDFVSRIVREHLERSWEKLYLPQVEAEDFNNWK